MELLPIKDLLELTGEALVARGTTPDLNINSLPVLNDKIWGITRKKLTLIASRPSNGKSAFCLQTCWDISLTNKVFYLSLEQTREEAMERLFCMSQRIDNQKLMREGLKSFMPEWNQFALECKKRKLVITEGLGANWEEVEKMVEEFDKPDMIVLDYIQCVRGSGYSKIDVIDEFIKKFRLLAIKHNFAAVLCSQVNREGAKDGKLPTLGNLKSSGFLEEHADLVCLLHYYNHYSIEENGGDYGLNDFMVIVAKNKSGRVGGCRIKFYPQHYLFTEGDEDLTPEIRKVRELFKGSVV